MPFRNGVTLDHFFARFSILAQISRNPIVRLNTGLSDAEA
jgi:hypothetical protein